MSIDSIIIGSQFLVVSGFAIGLIIIGISAKRFGNSILGSILSYLFIGTFIFFVAILFRIFAEELLSIGHESMDIWWHLMFYLAFFFYFSSFKLLVIRREVGYIPKTFLRIGDEKKWSLITVVILAVMFYLSKLTNPFTNIYYDSYLGANIGLHHFIAFLVAGLAGFYLLSIKKNLGDIGAAIANPIFISIWAFAGHHLLELLVENWHVLPLNDKATEIFEEISLIAAAIGVIYASIRIKSFAKQANSPSIPTAS